MDFLRNIFKQLFGWLRGGPQPKPPEPTGEPPTPITRKVSLIIFNPILPAQNQRKLTEVLGWNNPETLVEGYIQDLLECSRGYITYQVVEKIEVNDLPVKKDGFSYSPEEYIQVIQNSALPHQPDAVDYDRILADYNLLDKVNSGAIDEVWLFAGPYAGFYESIMGGPGAFFCNAPPLTTTAVSASRRFIIMGFSYERGNGEMLESFGHRAESILRQAFRNTHGDGNLWERFIRYEKNYPNQAECGNVHYAPNSQTDYDWGNQTFVLSGCRNWQNFPNINGPRALVNCSEWGNGQIRAHHTWWLSLFPHISGQANGVAYNWWKYIIDPEQVL